MPKEISEKKKRKILEKMRQKQQKIEKLLATGNPKYERKIRKLKEEVVKMGKFALRGGKLEKIDDEENQQQERQVPPRPEDYSPSPFPEGVREPPKMARPSPNEQRRFEENIRQTVREMPQPPRPPPAPIPPEYRQAYGQEYAMPPPQRDTNIKVVIRLLEAQVVEATVPESQLNNFIQDLATAVDNSTVIQIGRQVINGRHIIFFHF